jgi:hypothetical protein
MMFLIESRRIEKSGSWSPISPFPISILVYVLIAFAKPWVPRKDCDAVDFNLLLRSLEAFAIFPVL